MILFDSSIFENLEDGISTLEEIIKSDYVSKRDYFCYQIVFGEKLVHNLHKITDSRRLGLQSFLQSRRYYEAVDNMEILSSENLHIAVCDEDRVLFKLKNDTQINDICIDIVNIILKSNIVNYKYLNFFSNMVYINELFNYDYISKNNYTNKFAELLSIIHGCGKNSVNYSHQEWERMVNLHPEDKNTQKIRIVNCSSCNSKFDFQMHYKFEPHIGRVYLGINCDNKNKCCLKDTLGIEEIEKRPIWIHVTCKHLKLKK